jgi:3-phosphoshikimate 1-carboxyvinyltransferase
MRERPIGGLVDPLRELGAEIRYPGRKGFPPIEIRARWLKGGPVRVTADESSQFASALLLVGVDVEVSAAVSAPYIAMTRQVVREFGREFHVEPDAAAAGYWWAMAAATGGRARVRGLGPSCAQPEAALARDLERMGRPLRGIDVDMNDHPDSVPALAAVALFAQGPTRVRNVRHLRFKETDRLAALARELGKCGARVVEHADGLEIDPPASVRGAEIETYGDHRMAMSFAVVGSAAPGIVIRDPDCVSKSYPGFWEDVARAGIGVRRSDE